MNQLTILFNENIITILVSLGALVVSVISLIISNKTTLKVSSAKHHIIEDMKYSLLQVIATLRAIDSGAAANMDVLCDETIPQKVREKVRCDFSREIEILHKLQCSPGYLFFLNSISDIKKRTEIESMFMNITKRIDILDLFFLRRATHELLKDIKNNISDSLKKNDKMFQEMASLCEMEGVYSNLEKINQIGEEVKRFIDYLEKERGIKDPEICFNSDGIIPGQYDEEYTKFKNQRE